MQSTRVLLQQQRQPMIRFLGKRTPPHKSSSSSSSESSPLPHPAAPSSSLPESFAQYRQKAIQHGPLKTTPPQAEPTTVGRSGGAMSSRSGHSLGSVQPGSGEVFDRNELPQRFRRTIFSLEEMEAIESGGASMWR